MIEPALQASHARAVTRRGVPIVLTRVTGVAPAATTLTANVKAIVQTVQPDATSADRDGIRGTQEGAITQSARKVMVMVADLQAHGFPLPVQKNDTIDIVGAGVRLNVTLVDAETRRLAGAIDLIGAGV